MQSLWIAALLLLGAALLGCGGSGDQGPPNSPSAAAASPGASPATSPVSASPAASPARSPATASPAPDAAVDWPTYQHDLARSGQASGSYDPAATHQLWESEPLDGDIYAQPLVAGGRIVAATENDTVYALDDAGHVVWSQHLGEPVRRSSLPCGNIDPVGMTGTPTIDTTAGTIYVVAFLQPPHHELVALDLASGAVRFRVPIDPPGASPLTHLQRGALALANGTVYVPFGGRFGDCGDYHGWLVGASAADGSQRAAYQVPSQREGGIWTPAGPAVSSAGELFVATGNSASTSEYDFGNAVIRLSADLKLLDWFAPSDWATLNRGDADLGSTGPTLLDGGVILQVGKTGLGYLLRADHLGQIGGEVFKAPVCNGAYGGTAHAGSVAYVPCRNGLVAVQVDPGGTSFSVAWRGQQFNAGAPTLTESAAWTVDASDATLYALNRQDGSVLLRAPSGQRSGSLPHFLSPAAANGRVYQSRGRTIAAFGTS